MVNLKLRVLYGGVMFQLIHPLVFVYYSDKLTEPTFTTAMPTSSPELIQILKLEEHPEGGQCHIIYPDGSWY